MRVIVSNVGYDQGGWAKSKTRRYAPELNGTTDENGEYGRASSTVGGRGLVPPDLVFEVPFDLGLPF